MCFTHGMRMCMWIGHSCWINFCHFFGIVNLVIFHYEFVKVCRCFSATNENIHVLSMKFPHLFLRPEIIITFLWGWEWSGGQVQHRSPRNSGLLNPCSEDSSCRRKNKIHHPSCTQLQILPYLAVPLNVG